MRVASIDRTMGCDMWQVVAWTDLESIERGRVVHARAEASRKGILPPIHSGHALWWEFAPSSLATRRQQWDFANHEIQSWPRWCSEGAGVAVGSISERSLFVVDARLGCSEVAVELLARRGTWIGGRVCGGWNTFCGGEGGRIVRTMRGDWSTVAGDSGLWDDVHIVLDVHLFSIWAAARMASKKRP